MKASHNLQGLLGGSSNWLIKTSTEKGVHTVGLHIPSKCILLAHRDAHFIKANLILNPQKCSPQLRSIWILPQCMDLAMFTQEILILVKSYG